MGGADVCVCAMESGGEQDYNVSDFEMANLVLLLLLGGCLLMGRGVTTPKTHADDLYFVCARRVMCFRYIRLVDCGCGGMQNWVSARLCGFNAFVCPSEWR
jgi:hypothetical protein